MKTTKEPSKKLEYRCPYHGNSFRDYGYCVCCDGATRMIREKGEQPLTKEPNKDFRESLHDQINDFLIGDISAKRLEVCILALCKEILVPAEQEHAISWGWNACRQHLLKQLGD